jgi:hypothetical protein
LAGGAASTGDTMTKSALKSKVNIAQKAAMRFMTYSSWAGEYTKLYK